MLPISVNQAFLIDAMDTPQPNNSKLLRQTEFNKPIRFASGGLHMCKENKSLGFFHFVFFYLN